jgi:hypothetical protein
VYELADVVTAKEGATGAFTTNVRLVEAVRLPDVPVIVKGYVPPADPGGTHMTNCVDEVELVGEKA